MKRPLRKDGFSSGVPTFLLLEVSQGIVLHRLASFPVRFTSWGSAACFFFVCCSKRFRTVQEGLSRMFGASGPPYGMPCSAEGQGMPIVSDGCGPPYESVGHPTFGWCRRTSRVVPLRNVFPVSF